MGTASLSVAWTGYSIILSGESTCFYGHASLLSLESKCRWPEWSCYQSSHAGIHGHRDYISYSSNTPAFGHCLWATFWWGLPPSCDPVLLSYCKELVACSSCCQVHIFSQQIMTQMIWALIEGHPSDDCQHEGCFAFFRCPLPCLQGWHVPFKGILKVTGMSLFKLNNCCLRG